MKFFKYILLLLLLTLTVSVWPVPILAKKPIGIATCIDKGIGGDLSLSHMIQGDGQQLTVSLRGLSSNANWTVEIDAYRGPKFPKTIQSPSNSSQTVIFPHNEASALTGTRNVLVSKKDVGAWTTDWTCYLGEYTVSPKDSGDGCLVEVTNPDNNLACGTISSVLNVRVSNATLNGQPAVGDFQITRTGRADSKHGLGTIPLTNGEGSENITLGDGTFDPDSGWSGNIIIAKNLSGELCRSTTVYLVNNKDFCSEAMSQASQVPGIFKLCQAAAVSNGGENPCAECYESDGIWTAVGCLPTQPKDLIPRLVQFSIGIAGGIALMLMLIGAFRISVSAGNPDALKVAKEMITNAIAGLIVIIFSAVLLQVIGVEILKIPGF